MVALFPDELLENATEKSHSSLSVRPTSSTTPNTLNLNPRCAGRNLHVSISAKHDPHHDYAGKLGASFKYHVDFLDKVDRGYESVN